MKKFRFSLETLLRVKTSQEDQARQRLRLSQAALAEEEQRLKGLTDREYLLVNELRRLKTLRSVVSKLLLFQNFRQKLKAEIDVQENVVCGCRETVEEQKKLLVEARRNRLVLEKLKKKKFEVYRQECLREEQLLIDEVAGRRGRAVIGRYQNL